jgi:hypothetical protein
MVVVGGILPVPGAGEETGDGRTMTRARKPGDGRGGLGSVEERVVTTEHERVVMVVVVEKVLAHD